MFRRFASKRKLCPDLDSAEGKDCFNPANELGDAEDLYLVQQLRSGNHDALTVLFERYSGMVFWIARRMLRDDGEAEEVVQQVFLDTFKAIDQFDHNKSSYKTWLFRFAYTRTINRRKHLETQAFYSSEELEEEEFPAELYEGAGRRLQLSSPEVVRLVEQLLKSIKPRQRDAIKLTFFEGLTAQEIAAKTGETPDMVRHNLYRGLAKLRELLTHRGADGKGAQNGAEGVFLAPARPL